jgi:acetyl esterase/lipase
VDQAYLPTVTAMAAVPSVDWTDPHAVRERRKTKIPPPPIPDGVAVQDYQVMESDEHSAVLIRIYRPANETAVLPCVYWMHGGGYVGGSFDGNNDLAGAWALELNCAVASVHYRLAPEHPYPAALDDCYSGLQWVFANASTLQVDASRVLIAGASAGGGLCAALALQIRDRAELHVTHQVLIYPMIDDRMQTESSQWITWVWTRQSNENAWRAYLGDRFGGDVPQYAAPSRATDVHGLPPTFIIVGSLDLFLDEDMEYANRLMRVGVPTELHVYPGAPHGFDLARIGDSRVGRRARCELRAFLGRALASDPGRSR